MLRLRVLSTCIQKLDRMEWAAGFSFKSYGVKVGVRSNDEEALQRVYEHLPHGWEKVSAPIVDRLYSIIIGGSEGGGRIRRFNLLYSNHVQLVRSFEVAEIFDSLESDLRLFVAEVARNRVFVHAGVVGWKGKAIVIPGRSFTGKSTLVAELVKAGASYYSDEYAVFDSRGRVHPFLKPLEIREEGDSQQAKLSVAELGGVSGVKPLPVGLVLITNFKKTAKWRPREISAGNGVLELLANTVSARRKPEQALAMLQQVAATAQIVKGTRGHAAELVPVLLDRSW